MTTGARLDCPVQGALSAVADRQSLLVVREVLLGNRRFTQILERTGLSRDVLTARLERLVDAGVLERVAVSPRRQEYAATPAGQDLLPVLLALGRWAITHLPTPDGRPGWDPALLALAAAPATASAG